MRRASAVHGRVKCERVGIGLRAALVENGCQIGAAAEPPLAGHDHARIHVNGGHVGIARVGDQRNAGRPKVWAFLGTWDLLAELRREFAVDGRGMNADFFEDAAVHHAHYAAAAVLARGMIGACPWRHDEVAGRIAAMRRRFGKARFQFFEVP